jgi:hypothetical protein
MTSEATQIKNIRTRAIKKLTGYTGKLDAKTQRDFLGVLTDTIVETAIASPIGKSSVKSLIKIIRGDTSVMSSIASVAKSHNIPLPLVKNRTDEVMEASPEKQIRRKIDFQSEILTPQRIEELASAQTNKYIPFIGDQLPSFDINLENIKAFVEKPAETSKFFSEALWSKAKHNTIDTQFVKDNLGRLVSKSALSSARKVPLTHEEEGMFFKAFKKAEQQETLETMIFMAKGLKQDIGLTPAKKTIVEEIIKSPNREVMIQNINRYGESLAKEDVVKTPDEVKYPDPPPQTTPEEVKYPDPLPQQTPVPTPSVPTPTPIPLAPIPQPTPIPVAPSAPSSIIAIPIPPITAPPIQTPAPNQPAEVETASMLAPELETFDVSIIPEPNIIDFIRFGTEIPNLTTLNTEDNALLHANEIQHNERFSNNFYRHTDNFNSNNWSLPLAKEHTEAFFIKQFDFRRMEFDYEKQMTQYFTPEKLSNIEYRTIDV